MGYLVPFTQYEYVQYTNRATAAKNLRRYTVSSPNPIQPILFIRSNDRTVMFDIEKKEEHRRLETNGDKRRKSAAAINRTLSDLTGLGKFIDVGV